MCATYYARTSDHGYETCAEHLAMAGCLAGGFAKGFGYLDDGLLAGLVHDLGKYSDAFQRRIRNPDHCGPVDHSTAGALLLMRHACPLAAMAVAGHHAGLPDLGSYGELEGPTFMSRMNRARRAGDCNPLALAQAGEAQLDIPQSAFLHGTRSAKPMTSSKRSERWSLYTDMMLTRMLFSALVDADRLDAEFFTSNRIDRAEHHILESLKKHLGPQNLTSGRVPAFDALREASLTVSVERDAEDRSRIDRLAAIMEEAADGYLAAPDKRPIDIRRCELLERCLACGKDPSYGTGLYTLTAPTGSGKTISSIAFALEHARTNNLRRVIYVIPYTSIIDQTVGQFEAIFGTDAVLPHYSEAPYQLKNESDMDETDLRRALAAENWNAPIVVTTAVQFFESLYSNATSRCRKLHNIADSVIVFDEAQTLPVPYLRPCVRAIAELVERYGSTAVLCTATQPELQPLFDESFDGDHVRVPEISPFTRDDRDSFRRVTIKRLGDIALDALAERLGHHKQVLCVVNTRSKAQCLHDRLAEDDAEGSFCLTTLQCAADRQRLFAEIRDRLDAGASCRVVSTSLIEAGVDVDFPVAYREEAGLDSVIQTAGRCNREGRRPVSESVVHVFSTEGGCAPFLRQNIAAFRAVADRHADLNTDEAVHAYFAEVLCLLNQTIRTQSKTAKVSPQMAGAVMKAILEDTPYPMTLINAVERRINAEHDISPDKAAIIKAYYLRATTNAQFKEVLRMDINEESGYLPYVLGRMFSIYEQIQLAAIPGINTTIKDKYFTSASTTPARIFPILGDLAAKHMRKTWKSEGLKVKLDKALGELTGRVGDRYPSRLSLEERGAFQLGYYFENQKRFDKANKNNNEQGENND
ncbi:CRISPR-associated helicase Cas3' [Bifidobacterium pseudocatenulatum]|uniref:CRISPR-associated helicase Cas3' n=1 Tax=Bifidobacterium pseudocatenulatum TaxID=28026 RepID=UPI0022E772D1|nr:CRISPR-associated helicase Cas3' [Bifidobacterium pseudocatenulatum]